MNSKPQVNTLLKYRFVKRGTTSPEPHKEDGNGTDKFSTVHGENGQSAADSEENSQTTIPETPLGSEQSSPGSPVFGPRPKVIRPLVLQDSEESVKPTGSSPWLSKGKGKQNLVNGSSSIKSRLNRFRREPLSSSSINSSVENNIGNSDSESDSDDEYDQAKFDSKISDLKVLYPSRSRLELEQGLEMYGGDLDALVATMMSGSFDRELKAFKNNKKRKAPNGLDSVKDSERQFKRIRKFVSSSEEEDGVDSVENTNTDTQSTELDMETKEERINFLHDAFPDHKTEDLLQALDEKNWNTEEAVVLLTEKKAQKADVKKKKAKKEKYKDIDLSDEDEDYEDEYYDSEDSFEGEQSGTQITAILSFFGEATVEELMSVPGCSRKKAECIMACRPFENWDGLIKKFDSTKSLSSNLITGCKDAIQSRNLVIKLMKRCQRIAEEMETVVSSITNSTSSLNACHINKQPSLLNAEFTMKPYQLIGLNWLKIMHTQQLNGILADEMGLGKTIQAIAFLAHLLENNDTGPHVIIVPSSTIENWLREMKKWCPALNVIVYYGSPDERRLARQRIMYQNSVHFNVVLTTYAIATGSVEDRALFKKAPFHYAIFDEGHMLKNMASLRFQNLMKISAERRLLLTGTPLQNNLLELMSLLAFVMPDIFQGKTEHLKRIFTMMSAKPGDPQLGRYEKERIAHAKRIMQPFVLRRLKSEVMEQLPKKVERMESVVMIPAQQALYDSLLVKFSEQLEENGNEMKTGGMAMFMQLRKVANHPLLIRNLYTDRKLTEISKLIAKEPSHRDRGALPHLIQEDMAVLNDFDIHKLCQYYKRYVGSYCLDQSHINESGKFRVLDKILKEMKERGDRVLLFSQFTMMLDILELYLKDRSHRYLRLDGSTPVNERLQLIDDYNSDPDLFIFLLSTRAGGLGINLTAANVVILHDIDFNPYNDKQAEDRCHRLGQTRQVSVIRFVTKETVEEAMHRCAMEKLKLEKDVTTKDDVNDAETPSDVLTLLKEAFGKIKTNATQS
ncbi:SWI/SNF-related matrix-associated actin-dependent regulator of chromatin subfamily A containing DEAD/H box 1-like [Gigantopelta aegis]|uniref:SWI/SNF-related matrix-associated actin-dependent regulator of chromatin subfamily A containing DEAD/H box 1-like n=1 Tax=Gigantopelta aegis TaxID=1735272 RepID=UPI001B88CF81|nr:SWI/SNF-related matrix-associated actin-dependent regulator of chromatin subfamily A containing DEAD/H box 1-like [Gigantopelta aegis]